MSSKCDLLTLQGHCKRDPEGYEEDFTLQLRHYEALRGLFAMKPSKDHKEFSELVSFIAHVSLTYKEKTKGFASGVVELLERHYAILDPTLRKNLTSALILLRNKGVIGVDVTLPLFFKLFRVKDKNLRTMMFKHIVTDAKAANKNKTDDKYNRTVQSFLFAALKDENEAAAKKALAVLTEMYRRNIWTDAKTVNLVVEACKHPSQKILVAALKFFEGQDEAAEAAAEAGDESDSDADPADKEANMRARTQVSNQDVFKAYKTVRALTNHNYFFFRTQSIPKAYDAQIYLLLSRLNSDDTISPRSLRLCDNFRYIFSPTQKYHSSQLTDHT